MCAWRTCVCVCMHVCGVLSPTRAPAAGPLFLSHDQCTMLPSSVGSGTSCPASEMLVEVREGKVPEPKGSHGEGVPGWAGDRP